MWNIFQIGVSQMCDAVRTAAGQTLLAPDVPEQSVPLGCCSVDSLGQEPLCAGQRGPATAVDSKRELRDELCSERRGRK